MDYLDPRLVEGFRLEVQSHLAEAIEFAVQYQESRGERDPLEHRQAAQDALSELMPALVDATIEAYSRTLKTVDFEAVELLFKQLAIRAKLKHLVRQTDACGCSSPSVTIHTRKGPTSGLLEDLTKKDGQEVAEVYDPTREGHHYIPLVSIQGLDS